MCVLSCDKSTFLLILFYFYSLYAYFCGSKGSTLESSDETEFDENVFVAIRVDFPNLCLMDELAVMNMHA